MVERIVVTGGAGMLGSTLIDRLLGDGRQVHCVDLRAPRTEHGNLTHTVSDVRDAVTMKRVTADADVVVHCAAALPSYPADMIRSVIVGGTEAVLTAAEANAVPRVVHISSTAVYGLPKVVPTPEEYPREPVDTYSAAKAEAEEVAERFRGREMCVPILRPKTFLGPGRMGLFAMLFEWAEEGRNFPVLGRGDVRIQMFDVDDLVDAVVTAMDAPAATADDTFNLGATSFGTIREDFQAVLDAAGHGKRVRSMPARPALAALSLLQRSGLSPVYGRLLHKLLDDSFVSTDKARDVLGFRPKHSNQDAILRTYAWWREQRRTTAALPAGARPAGKGEGVTSVEPWRQGALSLAKVLF
ncbi:NAD-dependent epimerase/dehydratase family protein [Streptomyces sp. TX20-6-3]|uniref:NAD-dependent epimerase/dehydratase family protein n=1 Tax=Streptomyces sp. TX20-6-3 TaxID=3028705 RepID=UPI0029BB2A92|nr:NAD-dependent epimerase/dehydratase family protein [Streptomyces sp. TX20-6-3]MDX2559444.1 NAD-dependent epimerase/dehydratase family protein [Streptomyces sp. TX20-6-3]